MARPRFILVVYPAQGHINPSLQFAKRLAHVGADVTFLLPLACYRSMAKGSGREPDPETMTPNGSVISFASFSVDGYDDGFKPGDDRKHYNLETRRCGSQAISDLVVSAQNDGRRYICLIYSLILPWAGLAAETLGVPSVMLWIQPATVLDVYYYFFHGYGDVIREMSAERQDHPSKTTLPGLSLEFARRDVPSFMDAENTYALAIPVFRELFEMLDEKSSQPRVLVNTFDELEAEALRAVRGLSLIGIGPLIPSAFLDERDPYDKSFGGDLFKRSEDDYIEWLNSKPKGTVVYVSFGSLLDLSKLQMEEIAKGLLSFGRPFLWVIREKGENDKGDDELSCREELDKVGMIVPWCSQLEVLCNESLGCFMTHCGWNSTLESLALGVPMVGFPQWSDQGTNAKLIEDEWKVGVRVKPNEEGIVGSEEIKRCLELVMGVEKGEEMRRNAKKWKDLARKAVKDGGSSDKNLTAFVAEMIHGADRKSLLE